MFGKCKTITNKSQNGQKHGETYRNGRRRTEMDMNEHKFTKTKKETDRNQQQQTKGGKGSRH